MMTFPVSVKLRKLSHEPLNLNEGSIDGQMFEQEMCFYLDEAHQTNPPESTNSAVYLVQRPEMNVYTRLVQILIK